MRHGTIRRDTNEEYLNAWKNGQTGYPWIDAAMTQLRKEGWIHHLARHAVACFLTRGDLYLSWEEGAKVFDVYLLDSDWALNNCNWMWLSASAFFHTFFRVYSPVAFPQKTDKDGAYVRHFLPVLAKMPKKYDVGLSSVYPDRISDRADSMALPHLVSAAGTFMSRGKRRCRCRKRQVSERLLPNCTVGCST